MNKKREENRFLYFLEGLACISVIFIHCKFPSWIGVLVCGLARFAVPLFFMVSGYYLFQTDMSGRMVQKRIRRKCFKLGGILAVSLVFYLFWTLFRTFLSGGTVSVQSYIHELARLPQLFSMLILNDFTAIGGHLWFLAALLYCYFIFIIVVKTRGITGLQKLLNCKVFVLLLSIHVLGRAMLALLDIDKVFEIPVYIWFRNWLFMAFPFMIAGYLIRRNQERLLQMFCSKKLVLLFAMGVLLTTAENLFVYRTTGDDREIYLGTFFMVVSMFLYALQNSEQAGLSWIENIGRRYLLFIYIIHLAVIEAADICLAAAGWDKLRVVSLIKPLFVAAISAAAAVLGDHIISLRKKRMKEIQKKA